MIITISGPARAGKDYVGKALAEELPGARCYALADVVKEYMCVLFNINLEQLNALKNSPVVFTKNGMTMRTLIQRFATEVFLEKVDRMYWVNALLEKINQDNPPYAIITDVRFPHEMEAFTKLGAYRILVDSDDVIPEKHISEQGYRRFEYDMVFNNSHKNVNEVKLFAKRIKNLF